MTPRRPGVDRVLRVHDLTIRRDGRVIIDEARLEVQTGECVALMGPSGAGKTTILRAIAGLESFDEGEIDVAGVTLTARSPARGHTLRELHERVGMVFQFHHLFSHLTAAHNVWLAPVHVYGRRKGEALARAKTLLESLGVGHRAEARPDALSGGEAQRVAIARALAVDPPLLLMDEPTASLDVARREELAATLEALVAQGRTLVVATHDADFARSCGARIVLLDHGWLLGAAVDRDHPQP